MMAVLQRILGALAILVLASAATAQTGGGYDLTWSTMGGGGGTSTGGGYELNGTIGQPDAGEMSGGAYELYGGYWYPGSLALVTGLLTVALVTLNAVMMVLAIRRLHATGAGPAFGRNLT